jgi:hypothetical protein
MWIGREARQSNWACTSTRWSPAS